MGENNENMGDILNKKFSQSGNTALSYAFCAEKYEISKCN